MLWPGADVRGHGVHHQRAGLRRSGPVRQLAGRVLPDDPVHLLRVRHRGPVPRAGPAPRGAPGAPGGPPGPDRARHGPRPRRLDRGRPGGQLRGDAPADRVLPAVVPGAGAAGAVVWAQLRGDVRRRLERRRAGHRAARPRHRAGRRGRHAGDRLRPVRPRPARGGRRPDRHDLRGHRAEHHADRLPARRDALHRPGRRLLGGQHPRVRRLRAGRPGLRPVQPRPRHLPGVHLRRRAAGRDVRVGRRGAARQHPGRPAAAGPGPARRTPPRPRA